MNKNTQQEVLWCFRRWSRKPWAAFAGMCRFKYGHLGVAMSIILLATHTAGAQVVGEDSLAQYRTLHLDAVSVTARQTQAAATPAKVSQTRFLVDRKETAPLGNPEAVLRLLPSIDIRERGGRSTQADIAIRGGSFDQTMVMLAGIDFSDARTGHQSHSLPVDLDVLSDIAVVEGSARPGALSGAVDFRTAATHPRYLRARLEGGAWRYGYANLSGGWTGGGFGSADRVQTFGAISYRRFDGYRPNTDFWNLNAYTRAIYDSPRAGSFDIQAGFQRREWGSNGFYSLKYPDQFESTRTGLASIRWARTWRRLTLTATGSFRRNDDRFEMVRRSPGNLHTTYAIASSLEAHYQWLHAGVSSIGASHTRHTMFSTAMGELLDDPRHRIPAQEGFYPRRARRDITSVWIGHRKDWRRVWLGGLATLNHTPYGTAGAFAAEAGVRTGETVALRVSALRSMRLPTFTDLYYNVADYHPDPNLRPETAMTYRVTATAERGGLGAEGSVWYRRTRNVIDWEQRTGEEPGDIAGHWYSTQLNRLGTVGAELSARYSTGGGWLRRASLSYGWLHSDMSVATDYISKYALDYMRHKLAAVVGVAFLRDFTLTLTGSFYDRVGSWIGADDLRHGYRPYFLLDGRLSWESAARTLQIYLDGTNLLGTDYFDFGGLPMPGTWLSAGIVLTIR